MKLDEAMRLAIKELSNDGITLPAAALERLDELECFDRRPDLRFAVRTAIRSRAFERFANIPEGTDASAELVEHFYAHTGFRPELVGEIFTAYARATDCDKRYLPIVVGSTATPDADRAAEPLEEYGIKEIEPEWHTLTVADKVTRLNALVTLDVAKAVVFGATAETPKVVDLDVTGIVMTATLHRISPMGSCQLQYALYGPDDALLAVGIAGTMETFSTDFIPLQFTIPLARIPADTAPTRLHLFLC